MTEQNYPSSNRFTNGTTKRPFRSIRLGPMSRRNREQLEQANEVSLSPCYHVFVTSTFSDLNEKQNVLECDASKGLIRKANVFQLFWSDRAAQYRYVIDDWRCRFQ